MTAHRGKSTLLALAALVGLAGLMAAGGHGGTAGEATAPEPPVASPGDDDDGAAETPPAAAAGPARAAVRVFIDPETGELTSRPTREALDAQAGAPEGEPGSWLNTYGGDLLEEYLPDGSVMVDLRGRFQTAVVATIDPDTGEVTTDCVVNGPEASDDDDR